jgi:hypothetical protein
VPACFVLIAAALYMAIGNVALTATVLTAVPLAWLAVCSPWPCADSVLDFGRRGFHRGLWSRCSTVW